MPRSGRGGRRQGVEGKAYSNRTDLVEGPRIERAHVRESAQSAATEVPTEVSPAPTIAPAPSVGLDQGTWYPGRPITHGLATGPGAGPEVLPAQPVVTPLDRLKRMYRANPSPDLLDLILVAEETA